MPSSKREREYERRRYEKWQQRQATKRAHRRRQQVVAGGVVGVLVLGLGVGAALALTGGDDAPAQAAGTPTAETTTPAARTGNGGVLPDASAAEDRAWTGTISTDQGDIGIELDGQAAPQAVANFVTLAQEGYFDGTGCHRLTTSGIYVLQCGDPTGTGTGSPGYAFGPIENAPDDDVYPAGTIAMARQSGDGESQGSQFFLVYEDSTIPSDQAGGYTVFGRITSGLDVVQAVADAGVAGGASDGAPATPVTIEGVETQ
ncbi:MULTISPECIES: peptidylprolyl isomerase [unclassified Cellulomonas]|uniref:peptidylprolyl isomerase n=1 Tax=unclassified Cellulomonas TaxID=2620175 RepID=UPI0019B54959|nr:peptidylprolyl isomerase [Cellulomonas sp. ES6]MBD3780537.1 peptidylprolyl isomerase [Micrococcales bacterium]WHP17752.1 peptidylprolyl isomerase [Cellulomonas sp. ES6]